LLVDCVLVQVSCDKYQTQIFHQARVGCIAEQNTPIVAKIWVVVHDAIAYAPYKWQFINQTYTAYELMLYADRERAIAAICMFLIFISERSYPLQVVNKETMVYYW